MADRLTPSARSRMMRAVRNRDTAPERRVRRLLHGAGYRFRVQFPFGRKRLDLALTRRRHALLVHGCFWHGHDCLRGRSPQSNVAFWLAKIARNKERDIETIAALSEKGWDTAIVWECELKDEAAVLNRLRSILGPPLWNAADQASSASSP